LVEYHIGDVLLGGEEDGCVVQGVVQDTPVEEFDAQQFDLLGNHAEGLPLRHTLTVDLFKFHPADLLL